LSAHVVPPLLELRDTGRSWGARSALQALSLSIPSGQCVALVGPSGSGKTTLIRLLAGALVATDGVVEAGGEDLHQLGHRALQRYRARCGIVPQSQALVRQLSVHHNVLAGLLAEWPWYRIASSLLIRTAASRVREVLDQVGIGDRQWDPVSVLSGGQQQRVAVARALIRDPLVILADEPTASLDPATALDIGDLVVGQARRRGATLVFSTHHLSHVLDHVDRVIGLREGRVVLDKSAQDFDHGALDALYANGNGKGRANGTRANATTRANGKSNGRNFFNGAARE
jgi:phosphonate transport system ATP-binding protein